MEIFHQHLPVFVVIGVICHVDGGPLNEWYLDAVEDILQVVIAQTAAGLNDCLSKARSVGIAAVQDHFSSGSPHSEPGSEGQPGLVHGQRTQRV